MAGAQARLDGPVVDPHHAAGQAEAIDVDELGLEDAGDHRAGAGAQLLEGLDEAQVLSQGHPAGDLEHAGRGHPDAVEALAGHAVLRQRGVDLGAGAVEDDGVEAHVLEEGERRGEAVQIAREDVAADLDDGELLRVDGGVLLEVLLDLLARTEVAEEPDDDVFGAGHASLSVEDALVGREGLGELGDGDPLPRGVRLGDVARPVDDGIEAGLGEERRLGPEVDRLARRQAELGGERRGAREPAGAGKGGATKPGVQVTRSGCGASAPRAESSSWGRWSGRGRTP